MGSTKRLTVLVLVTSCICPKNCRNNELAKGLQKVLYTNPWGALSCLPNSGQYNKTNHLRCHFDIKPTHSDESQIYTKLTWNRFDITGSFMPECSARKVSVYVG